MTSNAEIEARIQAFRADLEALTDDLMVQKHITFGNSYILDSDRYFNLKYEIASRFGLHSSQVILVGSGKLGFSIVPGKRYRPFGDGSDLDIAIVSEELFDTLWLRVFEYWNRRGNWQRQDSFRDYLFRGWLRPDYLPPSLEYHSQWFAYFRELTESRRFGPYNISAGVYKSWWYLERYQQRAVARCRQQ